MVDWNNSNYLEEEKRLLQEQQLEAERARRRHQQQEEQRLLAEEQRAIDQEPGILHFLKTRSFLNYREFDRTFNTCGSNLSFAT